MSGNMLPPVVAELKANATQFHATIDGAKSSMSKLGHEGDSVGSKLKAGLGGGLASASGEAGGLMGKMGGLAASAGPWLAAGTAAAGIALKLGGEWSNLGVTIGKLADATSLSTTAASQWLEVAGDVGVEAGTLQSTIGKMEKAISGSPAQFEALGVAIARTKDGAVDVNQTFLNSIDVVNGIQDPFKRSEVAAKLFGKGWQSMSELIARGATKLKADLAAVDPSKVFDDSKVGKARAYRDAMDNLHDAVEKLQLQMGEHLVPVLTTVANTLASISKFVGPAIDQLGQFMEAASGGKADTFHRVATDILLFGTPEVTRGIRFVADAFKDVEASISPEIAGRLAQAKSEAETMAATLSASAAAVAQFGLSSVESSHSSIAAFEHDQNRAVEAADRATAALKRSEAAYKHLSDTLTNDNARLSMADDFDAIAEAQKRATEAAKKGGPEAVAATREAQRAVNAYKGDVIDLGERMKWPAMVTTTFVALVDAGRAATAQAILDRLSDPKVVWFDPQVRPGRGTGKMVASAGGRYVDQFMVSTLGEGGDEIVAPIEDDPGRAAELVRQGARNHPEFAAALGGGGTGGRTVHIENINLLGGTPGVAQDIAFEIGLALRMN